MTKEDKKGYILILISILAIMIIGYIAFDLKRSSLCDKATLCPLEVTYDSTVIIIDKSDPWRRKDAEKIRKILTSTFNNLSEHERLVIKVIEPDEMKETEIKTYFDMCNPGNKANPLYQNSRKVLIKYNTLFQEPLKKVMKSLTSSTVTESSPILESIQESLRENKGENIKLIIVSDLLEYTEEYFNFYTHIPSVQESMDALSFTKGRLESLHIEYILRKHYQSKIFASLKFFKNLTKELGGNFSKRKLLISR